MAPFGWKCGRPSNPLVPVEPLIVPVVITQWKLCPHSLYEAPMGNVRICLVLALAACGSNSSNKPDAPVVVHDSAVPDSKGFLDAATPDAPPDASPLDFTCLWQPLP